MTAFLTVDVPRARPAPFGVPLARPAPFTPRPALWERWPVSCDGWLMRGWRLARKAREFPPDQ